MKQKFFSTGKFGDLCGVGHRTVLQWIQKGWLRSYKLPGRGDNRIAAPDAIEFLKEYNMPVPRQLKAFDMTPVVMVVDKNRKLANQLQADTNLEGCEIKYFESEFEAGAEAAKSPPAVLIVPDMPVGHATGIKQREEFANTEIVLSRGGTEETIKAVIDAFEDR